MIEYVYFFVRSVHMCRVYIPIYAIRKQVDIWQNFCLRIASLHELEMEKKIYTNEF